MKINKPKSKSTKMNEWTSKPHTKFFSGNFRRNNSLGSSHKLTHKLILSWKSCYNEHFVEFQESNNKEDVKRWIDVSITQKKKKKKIFFFFFLGVCGKFSNHKYGKLWRPLIMRLVLQERLGPLGKEIFIFYNNTLTKGIWFGILHRYND